MLLTIYATEWSIVPLRNYSLTDFSFQCLWRVELLPKSKPKFIA